MDLKEAMVKSNLISEPELVLFEKISDVEKKIEDLIASMEYLKGRTKTQINNQIQDLKRQSILFNSRLNNLRKEN